MAQAKLTKLEMEILEEFWRLGACSVREVQETFPEKKRPAYTTVQTVVYRLEKKKALRCVKRISNANIFEAAITRSEAQRWFMADVLALFSGRGKMLMAHLIEAGELSMEDVKDAEKTLRKLEKSGQ